MSDVSDEKLARALAAGEESAFAAAYDRYAPGLYAAARSLLGSGADAEDAVQDVWAALARGRERLAGVRSLKAYLYTSLRHAAARQRAQDVKAASLNDVPEPVVRTDAFAGLDDRLARALRWLPAEQLEVVVLKIDGGLTFAELGEALDISPNTAASRYRYALEKLRDALGRDSHGRPRTA